MPLARIAGRLTLVAAVTVATGASAGCAKRPQEAMADALETAASWEATARLVAEQRDDGRIPRVYSRQTLEAGREELAKARRRAARLSGLTAATRAALDSRLAEADAAVARAGTTAR